ncbi:NAD/NADP octopine/nopaline dehydrogenase family protein [Xenorhabdus bovienii]|uniref:NAD/NADP octopine/nopaline dehydrogenase family protein n=1 Tax=Xenorhabdus bovienii TaxID=40576 RepID=UPI0004D66170|nr:NAD/NADP octopine/nopaline dehydrogenase family protein [Xenorhabdus bovienii]CDG86480.1 putative NAD/NADP octopine/nopaline dehydrogenase [Xenorhabdus bovienii str. feltiae France]CDG90750.1 putative NAD/NADP octopine/nopaline dehydrogenase [Xenorhabdus bovienii str. feltiae Florida]
MKDRIALIIGGGNVGHAIAFNISKNIKTFLIAHEKLLWNNFLCCHNEKSTNFTVLSWSDIIDFTPDFIFITLPLLYRKKAIELIKKNKIKPTNIIAIPGYGGFEIQLESDTYFNEFNYGSLQRVPYISRIISYGKEVNITSKKEALFLYTHKEQEKTKESLELIFNIPTNLLESYYQNTLSNSNPLLHTSRLYSIFKDSLAHENEILFYEKWDDFSSKLLIAMDKEMSSIFKYKGIPHLHTTICEHYSVSNYKELTKKIKNIDAFKNIMTPMIKIGNKYIPDINSRYFTEDFGIGLKCINDIALNCNLVLPNISKILAWYQAIKKEI